MQGLRVFKMWTLNIPDSWSTAHALNTAGHQHTTTDWDWLTEQYTSWTLQTLNTMLRLNATDTKHYRHSTLHFTTFYIIVLHHTTTFHIKHHFTSPHLITPFHLPHSASHHRITFHAMWPHYTSYTPQHILHHTTALYATLHFTSYHTTPPHLTLHHHIWHNTITHHTGYALNCILHDTIPHHHFAYHI